MNNIEASIAVIIHILFPLVGFFIFASLTKKMKNEDVEKPPKIDLVLLITNYLVLLYILLTELFWGWSAIASLTTFYHTLVAPILMLIIAYKNYKIRKRSIYHHWIYKFGLLYCVLIAIFLLGVRSF